MNRSRRLVAAVGLALTPTACSGGGDGGGTDATDAATVAGSPGTTSPPTMDEPATTAAPTTVAITTTVAPVLELVVEQVAELPGRVLNSPSWDASSIVAASETDNGRFFGASSIVRLDVAGSVIQDVSAGDGAIVSSLAEAAGTTFAYGSFVEPDNPYVCGLRPVEPASLTLGPTVRLPTDSGCGGTIIADDVNSAFLITSDVAAPIVFRIDTGAGTVTPIDLGPVLPPDYEIRDLLSFQGNTYVWLVGAFDPATGTERTAPDGTPLQPMIARIDGVTGAATAAPINGRPVVDEERLVARLSDTEAQVLDPVTLAPAEPAPTEIVVADEELGTRGDAVWSFRLDDAGLLTVSLRDPATEQVVSEAAADTGFGADGFTHAESVFVGDELYIVASRQLREPATAPTSTTKIFRAALRPAP